MLWPWYSFVGLFVVCRSVTAIFLSRLLQHHTARLLQRHSKLWNQVWKALNIALLLKIILVILGCLHFLVNFRISLSISTKITLKFWLGFHGSLRKCEEKEYIENTESTNPSVQFSWVAQSCPTLCDPMDSSTLGFPVHHQPPELAQTHVSWVSDAIQPSHPLLSPSPPAFNLSQHQGLFQWVSSSHEVAKVLEFQLQHQSFQWTLRTDLL